MGWDFFVLLKLTNFLLCVLQLMSKSSEKPRLRQIPSEDMDSEEVGPSVGDAHQSRLRTESQRELESQEDQLNLQHTLILNQVRHLNPKKYVIIEKNVICNNALSL